MIAPDGTTLSHTGIYLVADRPRKLVIIWSSGPTEHRETVVIVEFREVDGGTELVLVHEGLPTTTAKPHVEGWGTIVRHLTRDLAGATRTPPDGRNA